MTINPGVSKSPNRTRAQDSGLSGVGRSSMSTITPIDPTHLGRPVAFVKTDPVSNGRGSRQHHGSKPITEQSSGRDSYRHREHPCCLLPSHFASLSRRAER
jgi:hypothetical protein